MKTFAYIVVSFAALAPMHAYAGQAQAPNASFKVAGGGTSCNNGISIGVIGKCNDVDVDIDIGQAQVPEAPSQVVDRCNNGVSVLDIGNCNDVDVDVDIGQAQVRNASSQLAWGTSCDQGISVGDIGNCMDINLDLDLG